MMTTANYLTIERPRYARETKINEVSERIITTAAYYGSTIFAVTTKILITLALAAYKICKCFCIYFWAMLVCLFNLICFCKPVLLCTLVLGGPTAYILAVTKVCFGNCNPNSILITAAALGCSIGIVSIIANEAERRARAKRIQQKHNNARIQGRTTRKEFVR